MDPSSEDLLVSLTSTLLTLVRALRRRTFEEDDRLVTRVQWTLLRYLYFQERMTVGQLAERLDVRQSTMSQMLDRLEKKQLLVRRPLPEDGRARGAELTPQGRALIKKIENQWTETLAPAFDQLALAEKTDLVRLVQKLAGFLPPKGGAG